MDYQDMLKTHNETGADITIGVSKQRLGDVDATNLGICSVYTDDTQVYGFREKPKPDELRELAQCEKNVSDLNDCHVHVNMGVYIFSSRAMKELVGVIEHIDEGTSVDLAATSSRWRLAPTPDPRARARRVLAAHSQPARVVREQPVHLLPRSLP